MLFVVPAGKRLIVEHFSSETFVASGTAVVRIVLGVDPNPNPNVPSIFIHFIAPTYSVPCGVQCAAPGQVIFVASQPVRMYVEAGQALIANVDFSAAVGANTVFAAGFSGYLVNAL